MTVVNAEIRRWQSIPEPTDIVVNNQLANTGYTVTRLPDNFVTPPPGSTPNPTPDSKGDSMWIIFVCVGVGLLVVLVGTIACIQKYKATHNAPVSLDEQTMPADINTSNTEIVFMPSSHYQDHNYHSLFEDPHV